MPSRLIAPAPASNQGHIPIPPKVPGHITVTIESSTTTPSIPVATISGQQVSACTLAVSFMLLSLSCWLLKIWAAFTVFQGHSSNLHHLMPANIQIIRGSAPALQIGTPAVPPQTFTSHLPRGMHDVLRTVCHAWSLFDLEPVVYLPLICSSASLYISMFCVL